MSVYHDNHSIIEDFEETFNEKIQEKGLPKARGWYWGNTLKSIPEYFKLVIFWRITMLKNYLKICYRNLVRNKVYSFINIFGLALGLAICFIISLWVQRELNYDRFHKNAHRIYRVERELFRDNLYSRWPIGSGQYKQLLLDDFAEIENAVRFWRREFAIKDHKNFVRRQPLFAVDNSIFEIFDFGLEEGDERTALTEPQTMVLTRDNARKYFGTDDAIGRSLSFEWEGEMSDFKVTGILEEVPVNSHIHFDMLISISSYPDERFASLRGNYLYIYILGREGVSSQALEAKMKSFVDQRLKPVYGDLLFSGREIHDVLKIHLFPITDIHLYPAENWELEPGGSIQSVYIFSTIAVLILVLACINFINLSTARAKKRAKEVGLRKTVGAGKKQLRAQFIQESTLSALLSLALALVLCALFIPLFNQLFSVELSLSLLFQLKNVLIIFAITLLAGFFSGLYPALYLTRFDPVLVLKGSSLSGIGRSVFRRNMVLFQFLISTILIFGMFIVYRQMRYIQTRSLGFDRENVVVIPARSQQVSQNYDAFRSELLQNTQVVSVSASTDLPGDPLYGNGHVARQDSDEPINMIFFTADYDYVETLKIEVLAGRYFSRDFGTDTGGTVILNHAAVKRIGWTPEEAVGKILRRGDNVPPLQVIGVVRDFNFKSLRTEIEPVIIQLTSNRISFISVRIAPGTIERSLEFIRQKWESSFPGEQLDYTFLDSRIQDLYEKERKMQNLFVVFSILAILVACLGLYGLAAYTAEVKTKEIGIRKILGASTRSVTYLLSKEFIKWIFIANVLAWPLGWFFMNKWLQNFAYRIHIGWSVCLFTILVTLLTALISFVFQALKAAWANPVDSLRYE
jgi:putative ABC transport system permease protein